MFLIKFQTGRTLVDDKAVLICNCTCRAQGFANLDFEFEYTGIGLNKDLARKSFIAKRVSGDVKWNGRWRRRPFAALLVLMMMMMMMMISPFAVSGSRLTISSEGGKVAEGRAIQPRSYIELRGDAAVTMHNPSETDEVELLMLQGKPIAEPVAQVCPRVYFFLRRVLCSSNRSNDFCLLRRLRVSMLVFFEFVAQISLMLLLFFSCLFQHGPFVMNTRAEIMQAFADYQRTQFGGWPWPEDAMVFPRDQGRFAQRGFKAEKEFPQV
jgi:hypothetical protein